MESEILCPVCNCRSKQLYSLEKDFLISSLKDYYSIKNIDNDIITYDYSIYRCKRCTLEFSNPMKSGTSIFYDWITAQNPYYVKHRWEYDKVSQLLPNNLHTQKSLIDIGCGSGEFLKFLKRKLDYNLIGIDFTEESIVSCRENGIESYCMDIAEFSASKPNMKFDFVTSFHVLEHVDEPISFISEMKGLLSKDGEIYLSTPMSPSSIEYACFDILNHPPHHLTRWNFNSYIELASQVNMNIDFFLPKPANFFFRALNATYFKFYGTQPNRFRVIIIKVLFYHFIWFLRNCYKQIFRERYNGLILSDVVLVRLSFKSPS